MEVYVLVIDGDLIGAYESEYDMFSAIQDNTSASDLEFEIVYEGIVAKVPNVRFTTVYV